MNKSFFIIIALALLSFAPVTHAQTCSGSCYPACPTGTIQDTSGATCSPSYDLCCIANPDGSSGSNGNSPTYGTQTGTGGSNPTQTGTGGSNPTQTGTGGSTTLTNPLQGGASLESFLNSILAFVVRIGTIVVILMLVYVGFLFVAARGEPEKISAARTALLWTIVGALILLGAQAISLGIQATVNAISAGN